MDYLKHVFTKEELSGQDFKNIMLANCTLTHPIHFTNFSHCTFQSTNLTGSHFDTASFDHCTFIDSKLSYLDFNSCQLKSSNFNNCVITYSLFHQLKPGDPNRRINFDLSSNEFSGSDLTGSIFAKCNLAKVNFSGCDLTKVSFENCDLAEARLTNTTINATSFAGSKLQNVQLSLDGFLTYGSSQGFVLDQSSTTPEV